MTLERSRGQAKRRKRRSNDGNVSSGGGQSIEGVHTYSHTCIHTCIHTCKHTRIQTCAAYTTHTPTPTRTHLVYAKRIEAIHPQDTRIHDRKGHTRGSNPSTLNFGLQRKRSRYELTAVSEGEERRQEGEINARLSQCLKRDAHTAGTSNSKNIEHFSSGVKNKREREETEASPLLFKKSKESN